MEKSPVIISNENGDVVAKLEKENPLKADFIPPENNETKKKEAEKQEPVKKVSFISLFKYSSALERFLIFIGTFSGILSGIALPFIIILYGEYTTLLVDRKTPNKNISKTSVLIWFGGGRLETDGTVEDMNDAIKEDAVAFGIGCAAVGAIQFVFSFVCVCLLNYTALTQIARLRRIFLKAVLRQDMSWYDTNSANNFATKVTEDLDKIQEGIGEKIGLFLFLLVSFVASVILAFLNGWKLTLVMLSCAPVIIICNGIVSKVQTSLTAQEMESYGNAGSVAEEVLSSIKTVMAFSGEAKEVERYKDRLEGSLRMGIRRGVLSGIGGGVMWFIIYCCYALAFWYGVSLILESREAGNDEYTPAVLIIVFFGVLAGAMNMGQASPHLEAFAVARGAAASVFAILERKPAIDALSESGKILADNKGEIEFKNVHFQYPARAEVKVLQGLDIKIKNGEMVALVGSSGCGKSTVMQLIQRLYDPSEGSVHLDGENVRDLNVSWLRRQLGVVGQEPALFATTIYENIRYGLDTATKSDVERAAKLANAHDFIMKLPKGYDTVVGQRGTQVSGGQKQRIAIARALIRNPKILLLDEATSALDAANERKVQAALDNAAKGRTTLVVTHRLSTISNANRIIVISEGKVVEEGSHEELVKLQGHYYKLLQAQSTLQPEFTKEKIIDEDSTPTRVVPVTRASRVSLHGHRISMVSVTSFGALSSQRSEVDVTEDDQELPPASISRIMKYNAPEWLSILIGCIGTLAVGGSIPAVAVLFGELYGVLSDTDPDAVSSDTAFYSGLLVVLGVVTGSATFLQMYMFNYAGAKLTSRIRAAVFGAMLKQEAGWFDDEKNRTGALCARLSSDASSVQGATGSRLGVILQSFSTIAIGIVLGFYYSWKMTLVTLVTIPVVFVGIYLEGSIIEGQSLLEKKTLESATKIAIEAISNIRAVASLGREQTFLDRYDNELITGELGMKKKAKLRGAIFALGSTAPFWGYGLSLWYGGVLVADEGLHYKNVIKVSEALIYAAWVLGQSLAFAPNFGQAKLSASRIFQLLDRVSKLTSGDVVKDENWKAEGNISFSKVEFSYPTRPEVQVLKSLNLDIKKGQNIALVGPSGCGKSTVIQLLQRLYDPLKGNIYLESNDTSSLEILTLRRQLGIVSQEPVLFDRTIAENIAYGDNSRSVTESEIISAAKSANIHDFIVSLPLGYETRLGTGGTQLSGGQKQRIAIARALIRNPQVLLLDEATSALDATSENVVQAALDSASTGRTTITVGHRIGAILRANVIYVLDQGKIHESGTHEELLANKGLYAGMHLTTSGSG